MNKTMILMAMAVGWVLLVLVLWHAAGCGVESPC